MKTSALIAIAFIVVSTGAMARGGSHSTSSPTSTSGTGSHAVSGHVTKNGTYVAPAHATNPNSTTKDNYSTKGNVNPYTGKEGTKNADTPKRGPYSK